MILLAEDSFLFQTFTNIQNSSFSFSPQFTASLKFEVSVSCLGNKGNYDHCHRLCVEYTPFIASQGANFLNCLFCQTISRRCRFYLTRCRDMHTHENGGEVNFCTMRDLCKLETQAWRKTYQRRHGQIVRLLAGNGAEVSTFPRIVFLCLAGTHGGKMGQKRKKRGEGVEKSGGPTGSTPPLPLPNPSDPVLNMKIYYGIMCSVCRLEGNHMKRSQTKSLLCSN